MGLIIMCAVVLATIIFIVAFWLGKDCEKHSLIDDSVGVMAHLNKYTDEVEKVIYYYSIEAYDEDLIKLKESEVEVLDDEK